jgi:hypothetical protein
LQGKHKTGNEYYPNEGIKFCGRFNDDGTYQFGKLQDEHGRCMWSGEFDNNLPHGVGWKHVEKKARYIGMMDHGEMTFGRTERNSTVIFVGNYKNNVPHGAGYELPGMYSMSKEHLCGNYVNGKLAFACYWNTTKNDSLNCDFYCFFNENVATMYIGELTCRNDTEYLPHGQGHVFVTGSEFTIVLSGRFDMGTPKDSFTVKKMAQPPEPFEMPKYNMPEYTYKLPDGLEHVATISFVNGKQMVSFTDIFDSNVSYVGDYDASDVKKFVDGDHEELFIRQGLGTMFVNGKKRARAFWYKNLIMSIDELFDDTQKLLWKNEFFMKTYGEEHDISNDWPLVHGTGKVFDTNGFEMYRAEFAYGKMIALRSVVRRLPYVEINFTGQEDYIVCKPFKKQQYGISINDPEHTNIMSLKSFYKLMSNNVLRDPLRGSFPALRICKIKFV